MSAGSRGLGKGLEALFQNSVDPTAAEPSPGSESQKTTAEPLKVKLSSLAPNPQQPRRHFSDQQMEELAASIKSQGILQPILVRTMTRFEDNGQNTYEIIAGERRWRAAMKAGLTTVPVVIREMNDQEVLIVALMENLQREDLTPMEEALGLQQLKEEFGLSQEDMAHRLGKSRSAIANTLRLLALPDTAREDIMTGRISAGHARALLMVTDPESQETFRQYMTVNHCTVREAESIASLWKETGELPGDLNADNKKPGTPTAKTTPSEAILALQDRIRKSLALPVSIKGKESKGTISFKYSSKEEFDGLLTKLGITEAEQ